MLHNFSAERSPEKYFGETSVHVTFKRRTVERDYLRIATTEDYEFLQTDKGLCNLQL
jgi:hypothetical protein